MAENGGIGVKNEVAEGSDPGFSPKPLGKRETPQKSSLKSSLKILEILAEEPTCTYDELAEQLGVSRRAITKQIKNLREEGKLRRIGPDKGGHWEVVGTENE